MREGIRGEAQCSSWQCEPSNEDDEAVRRHEARPARDRDWQDSKSTSVYAGYGKKTVTSVHLDDGEFMGYRVLARTTHILSIYSGVSSDAEHP